MFKRRKQYTLDGLSFTANDLLFTNFSITIEYSIFPSTKGRVFLSFDSENLKSINKPVNVLIRSDVDSFAVIDFGFTNKIHDYFADEYVGWSMAHIFLREWKILYETNKYLRRMFVMHRDFDSHINSLKTLAELNKALIDVFTNNTIKFSVPSIAKESEKLPGVSQATECPVCLEKGKVYDTVQHLNDTEKWSREEIADWLDDLQDNHGYDFTFGVDDDSIEEVSLAGSGWKDLGYIKEDGI